MNTTMRPAARLLLASLTLVACAPGAEPTEMDDPAAGETFLADTVITEAEQAAGAEAEAAGLETGVDHAEPTADTDGALGALAAPLDESSVILDDGTGTIADAATGCSPARGYSHGNPFSICVVRVDGKLVEYRTAQAFARMRAAAARSGVRISIVSGFRTMDQQRYLYNLYLSGRGNLAARPGYSNHQSGLALDLNTSSSGVYSWLTRHGSEYGFRRTVPPCSYGNSPIV